ncbi:hypothetical protein [Burkholderia cepacia]|uniref:hypothetical protein n=1 Tax=Burkholderia cepacia TaxID=292 RepID=UPI001CF108A3|nr:hypothetical protein [Burkholderia cepacia]MCA8165186.1 hypothetical protein [Burkholderia cepacia]
MTDFKQAFIKGQNAVHQAHAAKAEIRDIFARLARDVSEITDGIVRVEVEELVQSQYSTGIGSIAFAAAKLLAESQRLPTELWITARNSALPNNRPTKLALVDETETGYPISIRYGKNDERCHDKVGLEQALASFLAAPSIGERLLAVKDQSMKQGKQIPNPDPSTSQP